MGSKYASELLHSTHFSSISHLYTPWKRQKTYGFWRFQGVQKCDIGLKWVEDTPNIIDGAGNKQKRLKLFSVSNKSDVYILTHFSPRPHFYTPTFLYPPVSLIPPENVRKP